MRKTHISILLSTWIQEYKNSLRIGQKRNELLMQGIGFGIIAVILFLATGKAHSYALSKGDPQLVVQFELIFINLFMMVGLLMMFRGVMETGFRLLYEANDMPFLVSSPIAPQTVFLYKLIRIIWSNIFALFFWLMPPWISLAIIYKPSIVFYLLLIPVLLMLLLVVSVMIVLVGLPLVFIIYSRRTVMIIAKILGMLLMLAVGFGIGSYSMLGGERLGKVFAWIGDHMAFLSLDIYPHSWASRLLGYALGLPINDNPWRDGFLLVFTFVVLLGFSLVAARWLYYASWRRSQVAETPRRKRGGRKRTDVQKMFKGTVSGIIYKDLVHTLRDPRYYPMAIMLALIGMFNIVMIANHEPRMIDRVMVISLQQLIYGNIISLSFTWNGFKSEEKCWWFIRTSPITARELFWGKLLGAISVAVIYTAIFLTLGFAIARIDLKFWLVTFPAASLALAALVSINTAVGSYPAVALERKKGASTILFGVSLLLNMIIIGVCGIGLGLVIDKKKEFLPLAIVLDAAILIGVLLGSLRIGRRNAEKLISPQ